MTFYHPQMQETLIAAAEEAGAEVRRGVRVKGIETGEDRSVHLEWGGGSETPSTRLIVGVDGRGSLVRKWTGFQVSQVRELNQLCGVLFEDIPVPQDRSVLVLNPFLQRLAIIFPQGGARARVYLASRVDEGMRLQGDKDVPRFIEESVKTGVDPSYFEGAHAAGPLATFPGVYEWVEHPYKDGAALIGDAACTSDPTWGQGLSLTVRDARVLRDKLLADDDWDAAGHKYADEHDWHFNAVRTVEDWWTQLFYDPGPEAGARRGRVLADIENPDRLPDMFQLGPDHVVADEAARLRMFGDD